MDLFCKILNGEIPSQTLYEDDYTKVIMDINPDANGHVLVIPKKHFEDFEQIDNETLLQVFNTARIMKIKIYEALKPDGVRLVINYGLPQSIKHFHLHLVPVYKNNQKIISVDDIYNKIKGVF